MPSLLDLAKACETSYKTEPKLSSWVALHEYGPRPSGFFGVLFRRQLEDGIFENILAYRGTDGLLDGDMASNRDILRGRMVRQYPDALAALRDALKQSEGHKLYITGHSLGGGLAALCSVDKWRRGVRDLPTVTFNAPGVMRSARYLWGEGSVRFARDRVLNGLDSYYNSHRKGLHVVTEGDPIAHFGSATMQELLAVPNLECEVKARQVLPETHRHRSQLGMIPTLQMRTSTALCAHSIRNLVQILERDPIH
ncbi:hypothetical protein DN062_10080 [Nitrincola tibetensis]|uniref:Uncharacterized protein n=1 Tax=Nitrincola tibetensis TaxID=2219697 RepID=A0A364NLX6_9GAMM|nr:Mbeg1-like protein [Nitrincola tibetensis]RAU18118.1 hypothetical protein DN062_10080 [Nitrincola tibetensis]